MTKLNLKILLLTLLIPVIFSCSDDDDTTGLEGKSPTERYNDQIAELKNELISSENGWKMTYYTDDARYTDTDQQLGGWTFIMDFTEDNNVSMVSDFSEETLTPKESEYEIKIGSTVKLSFATRNYISFLSDSGNYPSSDLSGYGYLGDNQFLYYGKDGEDLIFRSNRNQIEIRFQKASEEDWNNIEKNLQIKEVMEESLLPTLEISKAGEIQTYDLAYNPATRFFTNMDDSELSLGFSLDYEVNGISAVSKILSEDYKNSNFIYDSNNNWFEYEAENGDYARIIMSGSLFDVLQTYYFGYQRFNGSPSISNLTSNEFFEEFNLASENLEQASGLTIYGFFYVPNNLNQYLLIEDDGISELRPTRSYSLTYDNNTRTVVNSGQNWNSNQYDFNNLLAPIEDILTDPQGLKVASAGEYDGSYVYTFTSLSNPEFSFALYTIEYQ